MGKNNFTLRVADHWNRQPREVMGSPSGDTQSSGRQVPVSPVHSAVGLDDPRGPFQPYRFHDTKYRKLSLFTIKGQDHFC